MSKPNIEYAVRGPDADGRGEFDDGFTVEAGSKARREVVPSAQALRKIQEQLVSDGVLVLEGASLKFLKNHTFGTPSGAASLVLGRRSSSSEKLPALAKVSIFMERAKSKALAFACRFQLVIQQRCVLVLVIVASFDLTKPYTR